MHNNDLVLLRQVQGIPGVIKIQKEIPCDQDHTVVVMEEGEDATTADMTPENLKKLAFTIHSIHKLGIAHTDIKLENLVTLQKDPERLYLIDWEQPSVRTDGGESLAVTNEDESVTVSLEDKKKYDWLRFSELWQKNLTSKRYLEMLGFSFPDAIDDPWSISDYTDESVKDFLRTFELPTDDTIRTFMETEVGELGGKPMKLTFDDS